MNPTGEEQAGHPPIDPAWNGFRMSEAVTKQRKTAMAGSGDDLARLAPILNKFTLGRRAFGQAGTKPV